MSLRTKEEIDELMKGKIAAATFTFSHDVESFRGMRVHGTGGVKRSLTRADFERVKEKLTVEGNRVELIKLEDLVPGRSCPQASLLIIHPKGPLQIPADDLMTELESMKPNIDTEYWDARFGKRMKKKLRFNGVLTDEEIVADLPNGQGTVMKFENYPVISSVRKKICDIFGSDFEGLYGEVNHYYDVTKCGIGFHGDAERNVVIGVRAGAAIPLAFQWFQNWLPVGNRLKLILEPGTMYAFDEKAVGTDWKTPSLMTLRHAAGIDKCMPSNEELVEKAEQRKSKRKRNV